MRDFVKEAIELEREGVVFRDSQISVSFAGFICDLPAKAFIACLKGVSYNPNVSNPNSGRLTFPHMNALPRTDQSFRDKAQPEHHHGRSLLEKLNVDMVDSVSLDPQHLTDLGVMRKLFVSLDRGKYRNVKLLREKKPYSAENRRQSYFYT